MLVIPAQAGIPDTIKYNDGLNMDPRIREDDEQQVSFRPYLISSGGDTELLERYL